METTETDKLLKSFFNERKQEIADNGFSRRVMRRLPEPADRSWIMWIFAATGIAISMYLSIKFGLIATIMLYFEHISIYYLLSAVFCFPLISMLGFYLARNKNYSVI
jgi:hypothetical protein